ncbi:MAG TPA: lipase family protein [Thiotrichales bacterium]|nr:lipase family protein [Thiotrichales bacterium]
MNDYFSDRALAQAPPILRAAYSDRMAWIMAEISRLVYDPLPPEMSVDCLLKEIIAAVKRGEEPDAVGALVSKALKAGLADTSPVEEALRRGGFELLEAFVEEGTEALMARLCLAGAGKGFLVLAFRGTQPRLGDVFTDIKADLVPADKGGRAHRGFLEAFEPVEEKIREALERHGAGELPLYITGHSLGGALALVATRYLASDSTGATYTFGCPRVGDDDFFRPIKTPVYRVVNAGDGVARVPFGHGFSILLTLIRLVPLNGTRWFSEWLRRTFAGYTHHGNLVFLSAPRNVPDDQGIAFRDLEVKKSPNIFWRAQLVLLRFIATRGKSVVSDHSIREYSQKLLAHAQRRNRPPG